MRMLTTARIAATVFLALAIGWTVMGSAQEKAPEKKAPEKAAPKVKAPPPKVVKRDATPVDAIDTLPDFKIELLHTAEPSTEGSWINLGKDGKGRLIIGGQRGHPTLLATIADGKIASLEKMDLPFSEIMGVLWAHDSLYVNAAGPQGFGLYRCKATQSPTKYDDVKFLKKFDGGGEHGPHGLALGQDGKIYVMNGNHTKVPDGMSPQSQYRNYREDHVLPRQWDGNGHAAGVLAPGGYVVRTDAEGTEWEFILGSFRNAYDIGFNGDGELFTFDSDMEWDWGMPWYRPTRINHCVVGGEYGWRSGTGVWPDHYPDSLPTTVDIGIGSPTGVTFGTGAKFPAKYQKAFYILDWSYGRIMAVHFTPKGATYTGTFENFVAPKGLKGGPKKPLNVTDAVIGDDGALYFTVGGRNTQAALYRVTYTGSESTAPANLKNEAGAADRKLRHELEAFQTGTDPKAVEFAWPHLGSEDRWIRFAARVAIESRPVAEWKAKALAETRPAASLTALLALARSTNHETQADLLTALDKLPLASLTTEQKFEKVRVLQLSLLRQGRPGAAHVKKILSEMDAAFPGADELLNREVVQVLVALQSPTVLAKSLKLMADAKYSDDRNHYLFHLRTLPVGNWSMAQRKEYLGYFTKEAKKLPQHAFTVAWFEQAGRGYGDGSSYNNFFKNFLREAATNLSDAERKELEPMLTAIDKAAIPVYNIKPRAVVKQWTMDELVAKLDKVEKGRNFDKGRQAYLDSQCIKCHRFGNEGGSVGPDLTAISSRFGRREMLESIIEPSKVLSDQYQNISIRTTDGLIVVGRIVDETADKIVIQPNPLEPGRTEVKKSDIDAMKPSPLSPMPDKLADVLTEEDILDLIAFIESGGRKNYKSFQK